MSSTTVSQDLPVPSHIAKKYFGESSNADEACSSWSDGEVGSIARFVLALQVVQCNLDRTMVQTLKKANEIESYSNEIDASKNKISSSLSAKDTKRGKIRWRREGALETFKQNIATASSTCKICDDQTVTPPAPRQEGGNMEHKRSAHAMQEDRTARSSKKSFSGVVLSYLKERMKKVDKIMDDQCHWGSFERKGGGEGLIA